MKKKLFALALLTTATVSFAAPVSSPNNLNDSPVIGGSNGSCGTVDLTNATSDYKLRPCETAVINFKNTTRVPLHIATDPDALYWLYSPSAALLYPNNMIYQYAFKCIDWGVNWDGSITQYVSQSPTQQYGMDNHNGAGEIIAYGSYSNFLLGNPSGIGTIISYIDVLNAKTITQHVASFALYPNTNPSYQPYSIRHIPCHWASPASWTSLGTLEFPNPTSGYVLVKRLH